jgi:hypothetical protein
VHVSPRTHCKMSVCLPVCLSACLSVCLSVCLSCLEVCRLQVVSQPGELPLVHAKAERLRQEYVVRVQGRLRARKDPNPRMATGGWPDRQIEGERRAHGWETCLCLVDEWLSGRVPHSRGA